MSESTKTVPYKGFLPGNDAASKPYDYKLIRDSLKTNMYKAINFLNFSHTEANSFMKKMEEQVELEKQGISTPSDITMFQALVAEAIVNRKWPIIEMLLDRIFQRPGIQMPQHDPGGTNENTLIDDLTVEQKRMAINAASKVIE